MRLERPPPGVLVLDAEGRKGTSKGSGGSEEFDGLLDAGNLWLGGVIASGGIVEECTKVTGTSEGSSGVDAETTGGSDGGSCNSPTTGA